MDRNTLTFPTTPDQQAPGSGASSIFLFLSLFLLVLAFFILLVSISTVENVKSQAVMDSLTSTFTTVLPPSTDPTEFTTRDGDILAGHQFQDQISDIFATTMQVARVEIVQPGRMMRVKVPAESVFVLADTEIRPVAIPLLDRIVAALSGRPPGLQFYMEFVIGSPYTTGTSLPIEQTLEVERAGTVAAQMADRGVPPDSIAVGIKPGQPNDIEIWFHVRSVDADRLQFSVPDSPAADE